MHLLRFACKHLVTYVDSGYFALDWLTPATHIRNAESESDIVWVSPSQNSARNFKYIQNRDSVRNNSACTYVAVVCDSAIKYTTTHLELL